MSETVFGSMQRNASSSDHASIPIHAMDTETISVPFSLPYHAIGGPSAIQPQVAKIDEELAEFWKQQHEEVAALVGEEVRLHSLPLARIKKIMKSDEDVRMISAESPVLFSKACEIFILELTHRAWNHAEANRRRTVQRSDVAAAISSSDVFDFLVDIVPTEKFEESMDVHMMDIGVQEINGVYPVVQGNLFNAQLPTGLEVPHPEQHGFFPHYLHFNHQ